MQLSTITSKAHALYSFMFTNEFVRFEEVLVETEEYFMAIVPEIVTFVCCYREWTFRTLLPAGPMGWLCVLC